MREDRRAVARVDRGSLRDRRDPREGGALLLQPLIDLLDAVAQAEEGRRDHEGGEAGGGDDDGDQQQEGDRLVSPSVAEGESWRPAGRGWGGTHQGSSARIPRPARYHGTAHVPAPRGRSPAGVLPAVAGVRRRRRDDDGGHGRDAERGHREGRGRARPPADRVRERRAGCRGSGPRDGGAGARFRRLVRGGGRRARRSDRLHAHPGLGVDRPGAGEGERRRPPVALRLVAGGGRTRITDRTARPGRPAPPRKLAARL